MSIDSQRRASHTKLSDQRPQELVDPDSPFPSPLKNTYPTDILDPSLPVPDVTEDLSFSQIVQPNIDARHGHTVSSSPKLVGDFLTPDCSSDNLYGDSSAPDSPGWEAQWWEPDALNGSLGGDLLDETNIGDGKALCQIDIVTEGGHSPIIQNQNCSRQALPPPQLMSPQLTNTPSPARQHSRSPAIGTIGGSTSPSEQYHLRSGTVNVMGHQDISYQARISPAESSANLQSQPINPVSRAPSPVFRVSVYNRGDSPARSGSRLARSPSQRSRTSQSSNLLAPVYCFSSDDEDDEPVKQSQPHLSTHQIARTDDGSWLTSGAGGQGGIDPTGRGDSYVPSIRQLEEKRYLDEKNSDVASWLERSEAGSSIVNGAYLMDDRSEGWSARRRPRARTVGARADPLGPKILSDTNIPGPGATIDEDSEADYSEGDFSQNPSSDSPPAEIEAQRYGIEDCSSPFEEIPPEYQEPLPRQFITARLWQDPHRGPEVSDRVSQPITANAAIYQYDLQASKSGAASHIATWGSRRRLSDTDIQSVSSRRKERGQSIIQMKDKIVQQASNIITGRSNSFSKSRGVDTTNNKSTAESGQQKKPASSVSSFNPLQRIPSGRRKSPSLNTKDAMVAMTSPLTAVGQSTSASAETGNGPTSPLGKFRRARSKSESRSPAKLRVTTPRSGGERRLNLGAGILNQGTTLIEKQVPVGVDDREAVNVGHVKDVNQTVKIDLKVKKENIVPTCEGFHVHVQGLNPRLEPFLAERIVQEQCRRHKKLLEIKINHTDTIRGTGRCRSGNFCLELGGEAKDIPVPANSKHSDMSSGQFQILDNANLNEDVDTVADSATSAALFPAGIPLPPVKRLPAEFECPICFEVKKIQKPSDWTKHVHEDVQPFTCTFPNCPEVRSFKRKADWVRHENEKHRQLEWWRCQMPDCNHECYRKDNFVQHLVREHKRRDPKVKPQRASGANSDPNAAWHAQIWQCEVDEVWKLVDTCHVQTQKNARDEICKFCQNSCDDWKKLTVHLAKHMEQIAMPILDLVRRRIVVSEAGIGLGQDVLSSEAVTSTPNTGNRADNLSPQVGSLSIQSGGFRHATQSPSIFSPESRFTNSMQHSPSFSNAARSSQDGSLGLQPPNMALFAEIHSLPQNMSYGPYQAASHTSGSLVDPSGVAHTYPPTSTARRSPQTATRVPGTHLGIMTGSPLYQDRPLQNEMFCSPTTEIGMYDQQFDPSTTSHLQQPCPTAQVIYHHGGLAPGMSNQLPRDPAYDPRPHHPTAFLPNQPHGQNFWYSPAQ